MLLFVKDLTRLPMLNLGGNQISDYSLLKNLTLLRAFTRRMLERSSVHIARRSPSYH